MKRIISLLLILCILTSGILISVPASNAVTYGYLLGDVDDDGKISMKDVLLVRKYVANVVGEKAINKLSADVETDNTINLKDVLKIRKILAGVFAVGGNNIDNRYKVDTITIGGKNISRYTIVIPEGNENMEFAADEIKKYVNDACGVALNITKDSAGVKGYSIKYRFDTEDKYDLGKEGYKVTLLESGDLEVVCGSMRGPIYSAYYILRQFGWRFFLNQFTYLYPASNADIPVGFDETEVPAFIYRECNMRGISDEVNVRIGLNGLNEKNPQMLRYGGRLGTTKFHAHSFEEQCGTAPNKNPCFTSENTYNQIIEYNYNLIEQRAEAGLYLGLHYTQISCSPNDTDDFCPCTGCKGIYTADQSVAGATIRLANRVAEKMCPDFPGLEIYTISYVNYRIPPKMTRPSENVTVMFCNSGCNNHPFDQAEICEENGGNVRHWITDVDDEKRIDNNYTDLQWFNEWRELTDNIQMWYYGASFSINLAPSPNIFNVYNDFKEMAERGITGVYCEGGRYPFASFEFLRAYLASQMMWNPYMTEEEFNANIDDFMTASYGDGWRYVREYLEMSNEAGDLQGCWTNNFDRPWNMYNKEYFRDNYKYMISLFASAKELAKDEWEVQRIELCSLQCEFLGLSATYERDYLNGDKESREEYAAHYKFLMDMVKKHGVRVTTFVDNNEGCANFPKNYDDIRDPMTWVTESGTFDGEWHLSSDGNWV